MTTCGFQTEVVVLPSAASPPRTQWPRPGVGGSAGNVYQPGSPPNAANPLFAVASLPPEHAIPQAPPPSYTSLATNPMSAFYAYGAPPGETYPSIYTPVDPNLLPRSPLQAQTSAPSYAYSPVHVPSMPPTVAGAGPHESHDAASEARATSPNSVKESV